MRVKIDLLKSLHSEDGQSTQVKFKGLKTVKFLDIIWSSEGKKIPNPVINKIDCISTPITKELFGYWKQNIPYMKIILKPIYETTRKSRKLKWTETQEAEFTYLKNAVRTFNTMVPANVDSQIQTTVPILSRVCNMVTVD